jgi:hypothetical protein
MSEPAQAPAEKSASATQSATPARPAATPAKSPRNTAVIGIVGLVLTLAAAGFVLSKSDIGGLGGGDPAQPTLNYVAQSDIGAAATTLTPSAAGALVDDAQRCKIPLVSMTIEKGTAAIGSTIRIRSGSYVSPYFTITEGVQRVAVPYPAPYGAGSGTMVIEGSANGAIVGFTPVRKMIDLPGTQTIPVVWRPVNPC